MVLFAAFDADDTVQDEVPAQHTVVPGPPPPTLSRRSLKRSNNSGHACRQKATPEQRIAWAKAMHEDIFLNGWLIGFQWVV